MGERKGTNKYYPPDFDPKKHKSLSGYTGQHPLRERARKLHQGILIIRFEMPYNIWCDGCNNHIGMGVRYNAEKSKIGNYYTTPIYKFRMKCHLCDQRFEIKTDPANHDYVIMSGARRKEQRWDPKENEQVVPEDRDTHKKIERDAMYGLEHGSEDKTKLKSALPGIRQIQALQSDKRDDYLLNKIARQKFRDEKRSLSEAAAADLALLSRSSLNVELVAENPDDVRVAQLLKYSAVETYEEKQKQKREEIKSRPLFSSTPSDTSGSSSGSSASSAAGSTPSAEGSSSAAATTPAGRKQAALQRIGVMASAKKRKVSSNAFGYESAGDAMSSASVAKKSATWTQSALGIVRAHKDKHKRETPVAEQTEQGDGEPLKNDERVKEQTDNAEDLHDGSDTASPVGGDSGTLGDNALPVDSDHGNSDEERNPDPGPAPVIDSDTFDANLPADTEGAPSDPSCSHSKPEAECYTDSASGSDEEETDRGEGPSDNTEPRLPRALNSLVTTYASSDGSSSED